MTESAMATSRLRGTSVERDDDPFFPGRRRRRAAFAVILLVFLVIGVTDVRRRSLGRPGRQQNDFTVYYAAAEALRHGGEIYEVENSQGLRYIYPPFFAAFVSLLSPLGSGNAGMVWFALQLAMSFATYFQLAALARLAARPGELPLPPWLAAAPVVGVALPGISCYQSAQVGILFLFCAVTGLRLALDSARRGGWFAAGLLLALPVAVKLYPILPVAILLLHLAIVTPSCDVANARHRVASLFAGLTAGAFLFFFAVPAAFVGWDENLRLLGVFLDRVALHGLGSAHDSPANQSPHHMLPRLLGAGPGAVVATLVAAGTLLLLFALPIMLRRRRDALSLLLPATLASQAALLVFPVAWAHYFVAAAAAILFVPWWLERKGWRRAARLLAWSPAAIAVAHWTTRAIDHDVVVLGAGMGVWFLVAATVVLFAAPAGAPAEGSPA